MRILHLAYEDPLQPGSGGGSVRAREINRRLAERHDITALVAGYRGAKPRVEDGVRWIPVGTRTGTKLDRLTYFSMIGPEVARRSFDLVVEEFGAPFSAGLSPLYTRKPVIASVQWLFAAEMREKYKLPFDKVEKHGLRFYNRFIAVSDWLANDLRARRPGAEIATIPNGVEDLAYESRTTVPKHLLFVGRLDVKHKGGDLLFDILSRVRSMKNGGVPPLVIAGDGPDRRAMENLAKERGLSKSVEFRGWIGESEKYQLMADAYAVLMPSRYETFGMVAAEVLAAGGPLVAFDTGPLREVAGGAEETGARLVRSYDLDAFAREVVRLIDEPQLADRLRDAGRQWARERYNWDEISSRQEEFYLAAMEDGLGNARPHERPPAQPGAYAEEGGHANDRAAEPADRPVEDVAYRKKKLCESPLSKSAMRAVYRVLPRSKLSYNVGKAVVRTLLRPAHRHQPVSARFWGRIPVKLDLGDFTTNELFCLDAHYESVTLELWRRLARTASTIVDVGSHIGIYALVAADANPRARVVAVEPHDGNFALLQRQSAPYPNVVSVHAAVANSSVALWFCPDGANTGGGYVTEAEPDHKACRPIESRSLTEICQSANLSKVDLIKIDVEGYEHALLSQENDFWEAYAPSHIIVEIRRKFSDRSDEGLFDAMRQRGYVGRRIQSLHAIPFGKSYDLANWYFYREG